VIVCAVVALMCVSDVVASASLSSRVARGPAPDFTLETTAGANISLAQQKGKGVILFFFTTWCPYCRSKFPDLAREYEQYKSDNIELLVIDAGETQKKVSSFLSRQKMEFPFPVLLDKDMAVSEAYDVVGVPTFVLISPEGQVVYQDNVLPNNFKELFG
jgi:peroxiredoxin